MHLGGLSSAFYLVVLVTFTECFQLECLQSHLSDMSVIRVLCLEGYSGPVGER